jgi:hypothetical protein
MLILIVDSKSTLLIASTFDVIGFCWSRISKTRSAAAFPLYSIRALDIDLAGVRMFVG